MEFDDLEISNLKILLCSNRIAGGTIQSRNSVKENERSKAGTSEGGGNGGV